MKYLFLLSTLFCTLLLGCASATYIAPNITAESSENYSKIVNKSFNSTWSALIQYAGSTFFGIDNFEKQSGLLILSFGASNPSEYITGGHWKVSSIAVNYEGDYVDYLVKYAQGKLQGKMNIVVTEIDSMHTRVTIKARYIFTAIAPHTNNQETWSFDSGGYDAHEVTSHTIGTEKSRTLAPTYKAEKAILDAISEIK